MSGPWTCSWRPRYLPDAVTRESLSDPSVLHTFWRSRLARLPNEVFEAAYVDTSYRVLRDGVETLEEGTLDRATVSLPRVFEAALRQVVSYFRQNKQEMHRIVEMEVDISVEKDGYILAGKVDLLLGGGGKLELLDFKTSERPRHSPELVAQYERQLGTYAHVPEQRYGKRPERLLLYWTGEPLKADALMELPYRPELLDEAGRHFDDVVARIKAGEFAVVTPPERTICEECDLKLLCSADRLIQPFPEVA